MNNPIRSDPALKRDVAVIMSIYNGEAYLREQVASILEQTDRPQHILWRDDGSSDRSVAIMRELQCSDTKSCWVEITKSEKQLGIASSFIMLLRHAPKDADVAFSDQDDVWFADKIRWGMEYLASVPEGVPALYCARQILTDKKLNRIGISARLSKKPSFEQALTQNIATGCTVVINSAARQLLEKFDPPKGILHDWWAYLLVSGVGGQVFADDRAVLYYRQHGSNAVGAQLGTLRRALKAWQRGPDTFMQIFAGNVVELSKMKDILSPVNYATVMALTRAIDGGFFARLKVLATHPRMARQRWHENLVFKLWFLLGKTTS